MTRKSGLFLAAAVSFLAFSFGVRADDQSKKHDESHRQAPQPSAGSHDHGAVHQEHSAGTHDHTASGHDHSEASHDHGSSGHDHSAVSHDHVSSGHDHSAASHDHGSSGHEHAADTHDHASSGHDHAAGTHDRVSGHQDHGAGRPEDRSGRVHDAPHGPQHSFNREEFHQRMNARPSHDQRIEAHNRWTGERDRFVRSASPFRFLPGYRPLLHGIRIVPGTYYYRRGVFYDSWGWVTPPWAFNMYPRYGLWDTSFLAFALAHIAEPPYALFFYHHWRDAEIMQWMADTNHLAAENAELRAQIDAMNARTADLGRSGVARDPNYVPEDAQDIALSPDTIDQLTKPQ